MVLQRPGQQQHQQRPTPPLAISQARPLKLWPFALVGFSSICIAKLSLHPRLKLDKDDTGWTLRYDYKKAFEAGPADQGIEFLPKREPISSAARREGGNKRWILDTGANGQ
jgi:hypothetical protein